MQAILAKLDACKEAREWMGTRTLAEAWAECERPDWMLWLHARSGSADAAAYSALARKWAEASASSAWAAWAAAAAEAASASAVKAAEAAAWAAEAAAVAEASSASASAEWAAVRVCQCNDIRAALCCPVFNTPEKGGKDGVK